MSRQYEKPDCYRKARKGERLRISEVKKSVVNGDVEDVFCFRDSRGAVYVPYGSMIRISRDDYTIERGALHESPGDRYWTRDQGIGSIVDGGGHVHSMKEFKTRDAEVVKVAGIVRRIGSSVYDWYLNKGKTIRRHGPMDVKWAKD